MLSFIFSLFCGKEKRILNLYIVLSFLSPLMDIFSFSMVLVIMNKVLAAGGDVRETDCVYFHYGFVFII